MAFSVLRRWELNTIVVTKSQTPSTISEIPANTMTESNVSNITKNPNTIDNSATTNNDHDPLMCALAQSIPSWNLNNPSAIRKIPKIIV